MEKSWTGRETEVGSRKIRLGQVSADSALAGITQSLVLKGGSCCHLQIET